MCCEECPKYEKCVEDDRLKDDCCNKCPDYNDCVGMNSRENFSFNDDDNLYDN